MKSSELRAKLEELEKEHGDLDIVIDMEMPFATSFDIGLATNGLGKKSFMIDEEEEEG